MTGPTIVSDEDVHVNVHRIARLSTGRHVLAFTVEPVSAVLLGAGTAAVLALLVRHRGNIEAARAAYQEAREQHGAPKDTGIFNEILGDLKSGNLIRSGSAQ
ncbi:hypothetical protein [Streptomyces sp. NBC_00094]|uniref:hypothetical protein n=1 Tax=Streptomyces sp. NBC_00094 TaxID=2903620 RepID=UPI00225282A1|nr:hypothetical protein [Streptomyces sp. NBC_00094]MCX5395097.1 hypothetical protein [Streptomyces sp. NBC_00094]